MCVHSNWNIYIYSPSLPPSPPCWSPHPTLLLFLLVLLLLLFLMIFSLKYSRHLQQVLVERLNKYLLTKWSHLVHCLFLWNYLEQTSPLQLKKNLVFLEREKKKINTAEFGLKSSLSYRHSSYYYTMVIFYSYCTQLFNITIPKIRLVAFDQNENNCYNQNNF